jgi:hypothetical protein
VNGKFNNIEMTIINIYAPTQDRVQEQTDFYNTILKTIANNSSKIIWTGDFNLYMDPRLDQYKEGQNKKNLNAETIKEFMDEHNLNDIWRIRNPGTRRYTWRRSIKHTTQQSRLDYFIIADGLSFSITDCQIHTRYLSDHNIISITISTNIQKDNAKGTWKFNNSLLADIDFTSKINPLFGEWLNKYKYVKNQGLKWDMIKTEIRSFTIGFCSYKNKMKKEFEDNIIKELKILEQEMCNQPTEDTKQKFDTNTNLLNELDNEKLRGAQLRAKCLHISENEYSTQYFLNKEKAKSEAKSMTTLMNDNDELISDPKVIAEEQRNFYKTLYSEQNCQKPEKVTEAMKYFLNSDVQIDSIQNDDKEILDLPITYEEIAESLKELANNKSPGSDGLTTNFYKFFWKYISHSVTESILNGIQDGKLSIEQRRAVLTLLPKKNKDTRYLKNWRPLSLLNTDYKILAKVLAKRLQGVLPDIISYDQSGCLKGRSTFSNIRGTIDVINYVNNKNLPGYLAFIDYEKAFDTVKWSFLYKCLEKMNFGKIYIEYIKSLYNGVCTHVANRGTLSESFEPGRGIRQGCPISANLFIIIVEVMASAIRQNPKIRGIKVATILYSS